MTVPFLSSIELFSQNKCNSKQRRMTDKVIIWTLGKAYTIYMLPFYFEEDFCCTFWENENNLISDEGTETDVLYPYIMDFFQGQIHEKSPNRSYNHLRVLRLKKDGQSSYIKFWNSFISHNHIAYIPQGKKNKEDIFLPISFKILSENEKGFKAPHIFVYESGKVGILTFCIELAERISTVEQLKLLNYHLHKIHNPMCRCVCPALSISKQRVFKDEEERKKAEEGFKLSRSYIASHNSSEDNSNYYEFDWNIRSLIDMWICKDSNISLFSDMRMHLFTYYQIDDTANGVVSKDDIMPDLFRLSRCVNDKYLLPFSRMEADGLMLQSFENIYIASSVEGTAFCAIAKKENAGFINQMDGNVRLRYIWIYLLALIQRYTLLNLTRKMIIENSHKKEESIQGIIEVIKNTKMYCYYTDVSPYTQHNQFYQHCCRNLHIKELFDEIESKTGIYNLVINKNQEKKQRQLNWIVGILTVLQAGSAVFEIWKSFYLALAVMVLAAVIIYLVFKTK